LVTKATVSLRSDDHVRAALECSAFGCILRPSAGLKLSFNFRKSTAPMNPSSNLSSRCVRSRKLSPAALAFVAVFYNGVPSAHAQPTDISSTVNIDSGATFETREETYTLPDLQLDFPTGDTPPGFGITAEMLGVIVAPVNAAGSRPIAIFIHGQNASCYDPISGEATSQWPCTEGSQPVPSYRGFLGYQRSLAAQGWVTVSISGNGISGHAIAQDSNSDTLLRTQLVEAHLRQWDAWSRGESASTTPALFAQGITPDLQRLLLIGHSRGGSAANQVALQSVTGPALPWRARAQVLIAPVAAQYNPAPTVPVVVLLPACDGDVTDLQGQSYIDRARDVGDDPALRTAVFIDGANHDFFNTEWDPATAIAKGAAKDDAAALFDNGEPKGSCRPGAPERLSGELQRQLGDLYIAAAAKALVMGEPAALPLLDGSPVCAGASCRAHVSTHALGGRRQPLLIPGADSVLSAGDALSITACLTERDVPGSGACITADMPLFKERPRTPHFDAAIDGPALNEPSHTALRMQWSAPGGPARVQLSQTSLDADVSSVAVRVIVGPETVGTTFALTLVDREGAVLPLGAATLDGLPANAGAGTGAYWAQEVRFAIDRSAATAAGLDFASLQELQITPQSASGLLWVLDAWGYRPGLSESAGSAARFELSRAGIVIDAAGLARIPATVFGELNEPAEIYYYVGGGNDAALEGTFVVPAGTTTFELPLPVPAGASDALQAQLLGFKGIVATRRVEFLTLPGAATTP
jgi:dienelactone hydrolase